MTLTPAPHVLIVQPSLVDNNEGETASGLHVVLHSRPQRKVWRGIVERVGSHITDGPDVGSVVHYTDFVEVEGMHAVPDAHAICWDSGE